MKKNILLMSLASLLSLSSCHGILDDIYDDADSGATEDKEGVLTVDASSWTDWHYIDFSELRNSLASENTPGVITCSIPIEASGDTIHDETAEKQTGIYLRWYDVFGEGLSRNEFRSFYPTAAHAEPQDWDIAVHRNNVRTNGGAVYETQLTSMDDLPESSGSYAEELFVKDEWNTTDVWAVQDQMLQGIIGNQGTYVNNVLSSWLSIHIPPMPPRYEHNNHVFIVRLADGTHAALQLANYQSTKGVKCYLTINYKYPY